MKLKFLQKSETHSENSRALIEGTRDGIPVALGYLAVSFSLGIVARSAGLTAFQGFLASALVNASAGEYAGFTVIAADAPYLEMVIVILIANARYFLMSCAMSQRMSHETRLPHRLLLGNYITDEFFGLAISRPGYINPSYSYGSILVAAPCWAIGTAIGVIAGNLLPLRVVSALNVALYGMFLAIIVPPARKNKVIAGLILICFASSYAASLLPIISDLSAGTRTIILTVAISAIAAFLFPVKQRGETGNDT
ncbi:MAG TPA: AzlC family ABC transporter permease [Clostridiales bacterium]|jgi:predicted branched-subunit amino acid permease|nr:AzlC family ABC transporter permease [Clostridiales bacterium]